jgi:Fur family transcriptional regulator, ferric uptake regulator
MDDFNVLKSKLKAQGYRFTPQRQVIFQIFQALETGNYLNSDSIHLLLMERGKQMSLTTIYRNLKIMTKMGIIREIKLAQPQKQYELNTISTHHHHHLVCLQCHQVIKFQNNFILKQALKQAQKAGMQLIDCKLTLHTICLKSLDMGYLTTPSNWVCPRFITAEKAKILDD